MPRLVKPPLTSVLIMFSSGAMRTRADQLRFAIAYALIKARKVVRGLRHGLTEDERFAVADDVVRRLQERGDPWRLFEQLPESTPGLSAAQRWTPERKDQKVDE